jgi:hypothetical protein
VAGTIVSATWGRGAFTVAFVSPAPGMVAQSRFLY